jgi:hypothetical protein
MKKLIVLCVALHATVAQAAFMTGNELLRHMNDNTYFGQGHALGYVMGVSDVFTGESHCLPPGVNAGQVMDVVKNFLTNNPEVRHRPADVIVYAVLKNSFPCANKSNKGRPGA